MLVCFDSEYGKIFLGIDETLQIINADFLKMHLTAEVYFCISTFIFPPPPNDSILKEFGSIVFILIAHVYQIIKSRY